METALDELKSDTESVKSSKREVKTPSKFSDYKAPKGSILYKRKDEEVKESVLKTSPNKSSDPNSPDRVPAFSASKREVKTPSKFSDYNVPKGSILDKRNEEESNELPLKISPKKSPDIFKLGGNNTPINPRDHKCEECGKIFKKKSHLDEHLLVHGGIWPFVCLKCDAGFRRMDKLRRHMENCKGENAKSFVRGAKIKSARLSLPPTPTGATSTGRWQDGVFICEVCGKDCGFRQNLFFHMKTHEKRGAGRPRKEADATNPIMAKSSRLSLDSKMEVVEDVSEESNMSSTKGDGEAFKTKWRNGVPPSYWVWGRYICEVCKKDCGYGNNLSLHRKRTHGLTARQEKLGYNGEISRGTKIKDTASPVPVSIIQNPIKRKLSLDETSVTPETTPTTTKKFLSRAMPCYECTQCKNKDCMKCKWCHDKKKYGGPGRLNKRCITRRCTNPKVVEMTDHPRPKTKLIRVRTEDGGNELIVAPPVRTTYIQGGLVKQMACRACEACLQDDCGECKACLDKRKFGGPGKLNKRCKLKVCMTPKGPGDVSTVPATYVRKLPGFISSKFVAPDADEVNVANADISFEEDDENNVKTRPTTPDIIENTETLEDFIEMGLEMNSEEQENIIRNIALNEFELQKSPTKAVKTETIKTLVPVSSSSLSPSKCNIAVDYWEPLDQDLAKIDGTGVISDKKMTKDLCFVCASAAENDEFLYCAGCCQPVHSYCITDADISPRGSDENTWLCGRCATCKVCDAPGTDTENRKCQDCRQMFHTDCLPMSLRAKTRDTWKCAGCRKCDGCGNSIVSSGHGDTCQKCCQARAKGGYCPVCRGCYQEDDYDLAMMECSKCGGVVKFFNNPIDWLVILS